MKKSTYISFALVVMLTGCAMKLQSGVNNRVLQAALVSQFTNACEGLGGVMGKAVAQGSVGKCTRGGKTADLYVHRDFVLINSLRPSDAYPLTQYNLMKNCEKDNGRYESGYRIVGVSVQGAADGKVSCKAEEWYVTVSSPLVEGVGRRTEVNASARRIPAGQPAEGTVSLEYIALALKYATS